MNQLSALLEAFFLRSRLWVFLVTLLFAGYVMLVISDRFAPGDYLFYFLAFCLLYLPPLLLIGFRLEMLARLGRWPYRLIWALCFLAWPWLVNSMMPALGERFSFWLSGHGKMDAEVVVLCAGAGLLLAEVMLYISDRFFGGTARRTSSKVSLERLIGWLVILLVLLFTNISLFVESSAATESHGLWYWVGRFGEHFLQNLFTGVILYGFYYLNHYYLIPEILRKRGFIYFGFAIAGAILVFYPLINLLVSWLPQAPLQNPETVGHIFPLDRGFYPFMVMILSTPLIIGLQWSQQTTAIAELERERSDAELSLLKQQINPHFFFNTLNNLYALSLTNDKATPEVILQLSKLMRYVIYKGKEETVSLQEDIQYVEDYIDLQRIRLHKQLDYHFEKDILDPDIKVPPLLFITLVENAFKHGIEPAEGNCLLHLDLTSNSKHLSFRITNSVERPSTAAPGIGLNNLRRRLALRFPDQHRLHTEQHEHSFTAHLEIDL